MQVTFEEIPEFVGKTTLPTLGTEGAAGYDIYTVDKFVLEPGEWKLAGTGLRIQIPWGYEGQVRPRSGLALKYGITVLNAPGTIDCDYTGELKVMLYNASKNGYEVKPGDRVAQLVLAPVVRIPMVRGRIYDATERGEGGFGSTGN